MTVRRDPDTKKFHCVCCKYDSGYNDKFKVRRITAFYNKNIDSHPTEACEKVPCTTGSGEQKCE